jgi:hypothetical protein
MKLKTHAVVGNIMVTVTWDIFGGIWSEQDYELDARVWFLRGVDNFLFATMFTLAIGFNQQYFGLHLQRQSNQGAKLITHLHNIEIADARSITLLLMDHFVWYLISTGTTSHLHLPFLVE